MCNYDTAISSSFPDFDHRGMAAATIKTTICTHPSFIGFIERVCVACGKSVDDDAALISSYFSAVPFQYIHEDLRLRKDEIARRKVEETKILLGQEKLCLVLDLDNTLLHSVRVKEIDPLRFPDLHEHAADSSRGELFHVNAFGKMTKLRPFVHTFLKEADTMFKMYIYTMGKRSYANAMASLLDPDGVYFGSRVISKEDCTRPRLKGLDVVLAQENAVLIIDDNEEVWPDHKENHILVPKYKFLTQEDIGEESDDGVLSNILETLKNIHTKFFTGYDQGTLLERDVRRVLDMVKEECATK